jgi:NitT/TauT family transport system permease protein
MGIRKPQFFGLLAEPSNGLTKALSILPFIFLIGFYMYFSNERLKENPQDKILPSFIQMKEAIYTKAFEKDVRTKTYLMVEDTTTSLKRLFLGISLATLLGLLFGLNMGLFGGLNAITYAFMTFLSIIPPLAVLPIIFIAFGVDELSKVMLIFIGTFPLITRSIYQITKKIQVQQIIKAYTLGSSQLQIVYQVLMPQIFPRLIDTVRLSFGAGWLFLIASEAIASNSGLGYRIFLVRRYLAMDVIIPYTLWITFLGFSIDWLLKKFIEIKYPWYIATKE